MNLVEKNGYLKAENYTLREYTDEYYDYLYEKYETDKSSTMNNAINRDRMELVDQYCDMQSILDYGCGTGSFMEYMIIHGKSYIYGYELIPKTVKMLKSLQSYINPYKEIPEFIKCVTMWDVFEHIPDHKPLLDNIREGVYLMMTIPIFNDLSKVKESKHYIPNEHLYYFEVDGIKMYMEEYGFEFITYDNMETMQGREGIGRFVFKKGGNHAS